MDDEGGLNLTQGLANYSEYDIDQDAPTIGTDEIDFELDGTFNESTDVVENVEVEVDVDVDVDLDIEAGIDLDNVDQPADEISYEGHQDDDNPATSNLGLDEEYREPNDKAYDEIGYEEDENRGGAGDLESGGGVDDAANANDIESHPTVATDSTSHELDSPEYQDQATSNFGHTRFPVPKVGEEMGIQEIDGPDATSVETSALREDEHLQSVPEREFGDVDEDVNQHTPRSPSGPPDIAVEYNHVCYSLFGGPEDHDDDYFLRDIAVLDKPLSQLFSSMRDIIADEITAADELLIRIDKLDGLEFREHSTDSFLSRSFREVLDLYYRLLANDGLGTDRLAIHLIVVPGSEGVFSRLLLAAEEGHGLSELTGSSGEGSSLATDEGDELEGVVITDEHIEEFSIDEEVAGLEDEASIATPTLQNARQEESLLPNEDHSAEDHAGLGYDAPAHRDISDPQNDEVYDEVFDQEYQEQYFEEHGDVPAALDNPLPEDDATSRVIGNNPLSDPFEVGTDEPTITTHQIDLSFDIGHDHSTGTNVQKGTSELAKMPDDEHEEARGTEDARDEDDDGFEIEIGHLGAYNENEQGLSSFQNSNSPSKVNSNEAAHGVAAQEVPSAQTSGSSTLDGEEIDYDDNDQDFERAEVEDTTVPGLDFSTTAEEIDWDIGDDRLESVEANAANITARSAPGKRLRQAEPTESFTDESADNKRRRT